MGRSIERIGEITMYVLIRLNGDDTNLKVGGQCTGKWGVNTVKTL